ncbi:alpha-2-macroglobulin-like protein 1 [Pseudonaja textilis]|uniref:alpha-2-macroglobulin-like protein 1 n=1 Tax=Pseudonaja textilis TaxID=8673 RepID=UPI000EAA065D|nr:alpha-2-macroglobulin-like protein 1 [Pseudonaja textilis]
MRTAILLWILALLSQSAFVISDPHYLVVFPAIIDLPNVEKFCILLRSLQETNYLLVTLELKNQNHTLAEKDVEAPGTFECIHFQAPSFVSTSRTYYGEEAIAKVHILIRKGTTVTFEAQKKVLLKKASPRNLIQPSKALYKPGEIVKWRIVRLDDEFKAIDKIIPLIQLKDPDENRIAQWVDVKPLHGIVDLSFPLASEAALGTYTIEMEDKELSSKADGEFKVEEYELPKFEIFFKYPSLIPILEVFQLNVCGKYTYGKPVQGNVSITLTRKPSEAFETVTNITVPKIVKEYRERTDKNGCATFIINGIDINLFGKGYKNLIELSAILKEEGTGLEATNMDSIPIATNEVNLAFEELNPFYKQGFPYSGKIKVSVDDSPVQNYTIYLIVDVDDVLTHITYITDENGIAYFSLNTTAWNNTMVSIKATYTIGNKTEEQIARMSNFEDYKWLKPFYSESNSFLEIQHVEEELPCGKDQEVLVDYILDQKELGPEADHIDFYYLLVSKGKIVSSGQKQVPVGQDETLKGTFSLILTPSSKLAPSAKLLLFAVFADGEVAADVDVFTINMCFEHKVKLGFSSEEELPGSKVNLQIEAAPGAFCSVQAVDKSVLLKTNLTLTPLTVYTASLTYWLDLIVEGFHYRMEDFEPYPCLPAPDLKQGKNQPSRVAPWYQREADVYSLFKQSRLKILTNTKVKKPVSCDLPPPDRIVFKSGRAKGTSVVEHLENISHDIAATKPRQDTKTKPRTRFPENWIWDLVPVDKEGKAVYSVTVPDTITEWNANAFCLADIGFGLSQLTTIRVFQPFFTDLTLPYSVIRGETFQIKVTVFNFLKDCIQVRTTLLDSEEVEVKPCPDCLFTTCLCAEEAKVFSWNVTATQLGHVNISVRSEVEETQALCGNKISVIPTHGQSDTVIKSLLVKPEGVLEEKAQNTFLCSSGEPASEEVFLTMPEAVVQDSGRAIVSVIGDIMGAALENIDQLLQMPFGCGEQNMVKFVPNIVVLQYLEETNQVTPELRNQAIEHMKSGYQRQLLYKHDDGSYSAFGKCDEEGNTWLTAFVAKAFGQAKRYIYVDEKHIQNAVDWLKKHQLPSGCFESVGRLFNNALKGGVDDELSLTAYVTASLLELHLEKNRSLVDDALLCLKRNLNSINNTYSKALLAYVFTLAGDTEIRQQLIKELEEEVFKTEDVPNIETMAYVLLAHLSMMEVSTDDINYASQLVVNLNKQRNTYGGFSSTQDTVTGLQSLARYAALTYVEIENLNLVMKSSKGFQHEFHLNKQNQLVLQQASLPEIPGQYKMELSGHGCVYVQTNLRYNRMPPESDAFALRVETSPNKCTQSSRKSFEIQLEVSYTGQREASNMVLLDVNMISGYIPVKKSVTKLLEKPLVKKVEFDPEKISIYLDQLDDNVQKYSFVVEQETNVWDLKAAIVKVYDYYYPGDKLITEYNAPCSAGKDAETTKEDHN